LRRQRARCPFAQSAAGAGDESDLPLQFTGHETSCT
jgi:hypothetical protein